MLDICFSNNPNGRNVDAASKLLVQPRLWVPGGDYPAHTEWVDMAISQIESEQKRAMVAYIGSEQVGVLVYQRHKTEPHKLEIKNLSIERQARGRRIADFLFRQVEVEAPSEYPGTQELVGDAKITNAGMISFAIHNGMSMALAAHLDSSFASNGVPDVILTKPLRPANGPLSY